MRFNRFREKLKKFFVHDDKKWFNRHGYNEDGTRMNQVPQQQVKRLYEYSSDGTLKFEYPTSVHTSVTKKLLDVLDVLENVKGYGDFYDILNSITVYDSHSTGPAKKVTYEEIKKNTADIQSRTSNRYPNAEAAAYLIRAMEDYGKPFPEDVVREARKTVATGKQDRAVMFLMDYLDENHHLMLSPEVR